MNKKVKLILQGLLFILIIAGFIYIGTKDFGTEEVVDNERFDQEYANVSKDNVFKYVIGNHVNKWAATRKNKVSVFCIVLKQLSGSPVWFHCTIRKKKKERKKSRRKH